MSDEADFDIACSGCDLLVDISHLDDGESAHCPRCGHFLATYRSDSVNRTLSYALAALILLIIASNFSFLSFSAGGLENSITLGQTPGALMEYGLDSAALIVGAFILYIPAAVLMLLIALCVGLLQDRANPWLPILARGVFLLYNWAMVEVFIIGVIVALVKIAAMATVQLGISFWAYVAFSICFMLAVASLDRFHCWKAIERLETA